MNIAALLKYVLIYEVSRAMNVHIFLPYLKLLLPSRKLLWLRYETLHLTLHEYSHVFKLYANIWMRYVVCLLSNVGRRDFSELLFTLKPRQ